MTGFANNLRWARTNKDIAKVLGIVLPKQRNRLKGKLSEIQSWRGEPDFPGFVKGKGYPALEVIEWAARFAKRVAADKVTLAAVAEVLGDGKPSKGAVKALGNIEHRTSNIERRNELGNGEDYRPVESIRQLAPRLSAHFKSHVTEQRIKQWLAGQLPAGVGEPFPLRDPGRNGWNNPRPCFEWVEKYWMSSRTATGETQDDLFARTADEARLAEMQHTIDDARKAKMEADAKERELSDKWILREVALGTSTRALNDVMHITETECERNGPQTRVEKLRALISDLRFPIDVPPEVMAQLSTLNSQLVTAFAAWDLEQERARIDRIREACRLKAGKGS